MTNKITTIEQAEKLGFPTHVCNEKKWGYWDGAGKWHLFRNGVEVRVKVGK